MDYTEPNQKLARKYGDMKSFRRLNHSTHEWEKIPLCCKDVEFNKFSTGIALYFKFMKFFSAVTLFLFILVSTCAWINYD